MNTDRNALVMTALDLLLDDPEVDPATVDLGKLVRRMKRLRAGLASGSHPNPEVQAEIAAVIDSWLVGFEELVRSAGEGVLAPSSPRSDGSVTFDADDIETWTAGDWMQNVNGHCRVTVKNGRRFEGWVSWAWGSPGETGRLSMNLAEDSEADVTGEVHIRLAAVVEIELLRRAP